MQSTDKSLIDAHRRGDATAFGELVRRYGDSVFRFLMQMSNGREHAEDNFQETFKRVHEKAHTLRGNEFKPWLFAIAANVAIDGLRKRKRLPVVSLNQKFDCADTSCEELGTVVVADNSHNPSHRAVKAEQAEQVRHVIGSLPTKQRATLVLAYYQQLSYREVARVMGCSIGTVKTQMFRALKMLAQKLPDV